MTRRILAGMGILIGVVLLAPPSQAAISWNLKPSGTGDWDWNLRGLPRFYDAVDDTGHGFTMLNGILWNRQGGNTAPYCMEVSTGPGRYFSNPDTRIWVLDQGGTAFSVNDDYAGTLQSRARLWISFPVGGGFYNARVASWSTAGSGDDFELILTRRDLSESACTTAQTSIPWAKIVQTSGFAYSITLSPNAT